MFSIGCLHNIRRPKATESQSAIIWQSRISVLISGMHSKMRTPHFLGKWRPLWQSFSMRLLSAKKPRTLGTRLNRINQMLSLEIGAQREQSRGLYPRLKLDVTPISKKDTEFCNARPKKKKAHILVTKKKKKKKKISNVPVEESAKRTGDRCRPSLLKQVLGFSG